MVMVLGLEDLLNFLSPRVRRGLGTSSPLSPLLQIFHPRGSTDMVCSAQLVVHRNYSLLYGPSSPKEKERVNWGDFGKNPEDSEA